MASPSPASLAEPQTLDLLGTRKVAVIDFLSASLPSSCDNSSFIRHEREREHLMMVSISLQVFGKLPNGI